MNVVDIVALQKYLLQMQSFTAAQFDAADVDGDGAVDVFDLSLLKRLVSMR